ncbi:MAG TPA: hypothetical protein VKB38_06510 [Terracidiphilus sp.]|nr:hypothetical protein [Terracidiphilus sp.]
MHPEQAHLRKAQIPGFVSLRWLARVAAATVLIAAAAPYGLNQQAPGPVGQMQGSGPQSSPTAESQASINHLADANDKMLVNDQHHKTASFEAANKERQRQIADDAARLLELATQLKAEVDKTGKDTLSLNVIRKADTIEKLAKGVEEKMKLTVGAS